MFNVLTGALMRSLQSCRWSGSGWRRRRRATVNDVVLAMSAGACAPTCWSSRHYPKPVGGNVLASLRGEHEQDAGGNMVGTISVTWRPTSPTRITRLEHSSARRHVTTAGVGRVAALQARRVRIPDVRMALSVVPVGCPRHRPLVQHRHLGMCPVPASPCITGRPAGRQLPAVDHPDGQALNDHADQQCTISTSACGLPAQRCRICSVCWATWRTRWPRWRRPSAVAPGASAAAIRGNVYAMHNCTLYRPARGA